MRIVAISTYSRPHELDRGEGCWCHPEECEAGHVHHRDVDLTRSPYLVMGAFSEQRERS